MAFEEQLPQWENEGTQPPQSKRVEGWQPNEKPPASWFNWLFHRTYKALQELQQKAGEKEAVEQARQTADAAAATAADAQQTANSHASRHAAGGPDEITPEMIGAAAAEVGNELVDIRTPDPTYTPERTINVAGDMTRDIQAQFAKYTGKVLNVKGFGAKGDYDSTAGTGTDDTAAILSAIASCVEVVEQGENPILFFPYATGYMITSTITVPSGIHVIMFAPIVYAGSIDEPALVIGESTVSNRIDMRIMVRRASQSNWSSENCIGVQVINANTCNIYIVETSGFTIGAQLIGSSRGFAYNKISLGLIHNNKIGLDLTNENSGWCNENVFINGRFANDTSGSVGSGISRYGVRITSKDGTYLDNNNNVFHKPSFELNAPVASPGEAVPVLIEHGQNNHFYDIRNENNSETTIITKNSSTENTITTGYGFISIDDQGTYPATFARNARDILLDNSQNIIFHSGPMHKRACYYNTSGHVNIPHVFVGLSGNATVYKAASNITISDDYLEIPSSRSVGIFISTKNKKRFIVRRDVESSNPGRVGVRCYDLAGNILNDTGGGHPYVKGRRSIPPVWNPNFGGFYETSVDNGLDWYFEVGEDVAYIAVLCRGGSLPARIRSFSIASVDGGAPAVWTGYEEVVPGVNLGIAPPNGGSWERGRRIYNDEPVTGGPEGWICVESGSPGVWKPFGNIGE